MVPVYSFRSSVPVFQLDKVVPLSRRCIFQHTKLDSPACTREYSDDGVDLTLIRWMLSLTPGERPAVLQDQVDSLITLREKFESSPPPVPELTDL